MICLYWNFMTDTKVVLSYGQQRLWTLDQVDGPSAAYHMPTALRLKGIVKIDALQKALAKLFDRHESLRTVVRADELTGLPAGYLLPSLSPQFVFKIIDLSAQYQ